MRRKQILAGWRTHAHRQRGGRGRDEAIRDDHLPTGRSR